MNGIAYLYFSGLCLRRTIRNKRVAKKSLKYVKNVQPILDPGYMFLKIKADRLKFSKKNV